MAAVLIYNIENNRAVQYLASVDTPLYSSRPDVLVNPDLSELAAVPFQYWIVDAGIVREMTQLEKDAMAAEQLAAQLEAENAAVNEARIADLETKSATAVLNADKLTPIL